jgi:ribonuclease P protein component
MDSVFGCEHGPAAPLFRPGAVRAVAACLPECRSRSMLPRSLRMRSTKDFRQTTRSGVRVGRPTLVVHAMQLIERHLEEGHLPDGPRVGFVVSGAVGNAVTRNRLKRRLRHLAAAHVADIPGDTAPGIVVRALPRAATHPAELAADFGSAWHEAMSRLMSSHLMKQRVR